MKKGLLIAFLAILCSSVFADDFEHGLRIITYPAGHDQFTSLSLESGKLIQAKKTPLTIRFELRNRRDNVFGCIFRIITDTGDNIDLMYTADRNDNRYPILVCGDSVTEVPAEIVFDRWIPVSITLNPGTGDINLDYNGTVVSIKDAGTKGASGFRISFGYCRFAGYSLDDVAAVDIRDIHISRGSRIIRNWSLSRHDNEICRDGISDSPAIATNAVWLLDQYISWNKVLTADYDKEPSVAFGPDDRIFVTTNGSWIDCYDLNTIECTRTEGISGAVPVNAPDQLLFADGNLIAYNVDQPSFAILDAGLHKWTGGDNSVPESRYWNKTTSWWPEDKSIVSFGGYGFYHYNNNLLIQHPYGNGEDVVIPLDDIHPRYSATSAIIDGNLFIFGGRGNASGKQELSPQNYYDLYSVNLGTGEVSKLWEFEDSPEYEFMPGGNMVFDSLRNCFYTFTNLAGGTLISISPDHPGYELMSLPVDIFKSAQYSFTNLKMSADSSRLFGLLMQSQVDGRSSITVLSMNFPPINVKDMRQSVSGNEKTNGAGHLWLFIVCVTAVIAMSYFGVTFTRRRKNGNTGKRNNVYVSAKVIQENSYYDFGKGSIRFFGGFCVMDRNGNNITSQFTPTLKALTVLLILNSCKDTDGIISNKLNRILWPYKPEDTANNNRNVYISKLRPILETVGDITIVCRNRFWNIVLGDDIICDYVEATKLLGEETNEENIARLLELLLSGMMLPNMEQDWADEFKSEFSGKTIDFLTRQLVRTDLPQGLLLKICDTVFQHDFLNEEALKIKCRILYCQGKVGLAKNAYDVFCKEYRESLNMNYQYSFKSIIEQ